jgi:cytidyltransferase-like protein
MYSFKIKNQVLFYGEKISSCIFGVDYYALVVGFTLLSFRMAQKTFVLTSGYFNPLHPGHIDCLKLCKELGDELRVIVNNDVQVRLKTQQDEVFQNEQFRMQVVGALK